MLPRKLPATLLSKDYDSRQAPLMPHMKAMEAAEKNSRKK